MAGKYQSYSECKNSGVEWLGDIPAHWELVPLKVIAKVDNSGCYGAEPEESKHVYPVATTAQIDANGVFRVEAMPKRSFSSTEVSRYLCRDGDILVVKSSGSATNIISGKAGLVNSSTPKFIFSNFLLRISPEQSSACPSFIYGFLTSHLTRERIKQMVSTTTYPNLQVGEYCSAKLPLPPLQEQRTIAAFLDHETARIDRLIEKQQRLIELLKEKRQAVISHAVTKGLDPNVPMKDSGVEWLGQVPEHWVVAGFKKYLASIVDYRGKTPNKTESGVFLVTARNIKNGIVDYSLSQEFISEDEYEEVMRRGKPEVGDVLFTTEAPLGEVAQVDDVSVALAQRIIKFRGQSRVLNNAFLKYFIQSEAFQQGLKTYATGSTALGIKAERLVYLKQLVPPWEEQLRIVEMIEAQVSRIGQVEKSAQQAIALMKERRTALISAAVTGKIDVRGWQPPAQEDVA